jgi:cell division septation protein DedD
MQIDIPAHIEKLLFLHDTLVIPGFGGFTATRTPASTDFVSGVVNPPAKTLAFSENLTVDDGLLVADIADAHGLSTSEAARSVEEFVEKMRALLDQREIVTLPGVGRLYKNYVQKIQFLPDATNFNASSYGLPPLQFSPITRSREVSGTSAQEVEQAPAGSRAEPVATPQAPIPPPPMPEPTYSPERSKGGTKWLTVLGVLLLIAAFLAAVWYWKVRKKGEETQQLPPATEVVATEEKTTAPPPVKEEKPAEEEPVKPEDAVKMREKEVREQLNLARNGRECILVVATLSNKENADKLLNLLKEEGYEPYFQPKGSSFMVGIRFRYLDPKEIEEKKGALKALTGVGFIAVTKK